MSYSSYLNPRPEAISEEGIEGIIDLANLKDESKDKIEAQPKAFFSTYLSHHGCHQGSGSN
jgi:hypothetical protein